MEPSTLTAMPFDIATAVKEITNGHRQMSLLRALAAVAQPRGAWSENAAELLDGVTKSLAVALSTLSPIAKRTPTATRLGPPSENNNWRNEKPTRKRKNTQTKSKSDLSRKRTRMPPDGQTIATPVPMNDAYQWRKYGEKKIHGAQFPRCYYRCSYRQDEGCQAMKHVQQADSSNPPTFMVTNIGRHTCTMAEIAPKRGFAIVAANSSSASDLGSFYFGMEQGSCAPSASPFTEEKAERDKVDEEGNGHPPARCPDQQDHKGSEQVEVMGKELRNDASDIAEVISSMLCPMSPYSLHLEMTIDSAELSCYDDLWLS